jgi:hypothetical protein
VTSSVDPSSGSKCVIRVGGPDARHVSRYVGLYAVFSALVTLAQFGPAAPHGNDLPIWLCLLAAGLALWLAYMTEATLESAAQEIANEPRSIVFVRRRWLAVLLGRPGKTFRLSGQVIRRAPDGTWHVGNAPIGLLIDSGDQQLLTKALGRLGVAVEDERTAWVHAHRIRSAAWSSFPVCLLILGLLGGLYNRAPELQELLRVLLVLSLAAAVLIFVNRPPATHSSRR